MQDSHIRTPTHLWVEAKIKELNAQNIPAYIIHRGEKMDGVIYIKMTDCQGKCRLLTRQRNLDGDLEWVDVFAEDIIDEKKADDYISRSKDHDPDLWAVEIESLDLALISE